MQQIIIIKSCSEERSFVSTPVALVRDGRLASELPTLAKHSQQIEQSFHSMLQTKNERESNLNDAHIINQKAQYQSSGRWLVSK